MCTCCAIAWLSCLRYSSFNTIRFEPLQTPSEWRELAPTNVPTIQHAVCPFSLDAALLCDSQAVFHDARFKSELSCVFDPEERLETHFRRHKRCQRMNRRHKQVMSTSKNSVTADAGVASDTQPLCRWVPRSFGSSSHHGDSRCSTDDPV